MPTTSGESYAPGKVSGVKENGGIKTDSSRPNQEWYEFDPMWGNDHWYTQVITVPEGVGYTEIKFSVDFSYNGEAFFIAEGEHTEMPEECLCYYDPTSANKQNNIELTTKAKTITFGCYVLDTIAAMMYYAKLTYIPTVTPEEMATEIESMVAMAPSILNMSGSMSYKFYGGAWDNFISLYGSKITTQDINRLDYTFCYTNAQMVPFEINCDSSTEASMANFCQNAKLTTPPIINNLKIGDCNNMFASCSYIREFPEGYGEDWDWTLHTGATGAYKGYKNGILNSCCSLRKLPLGLLKYGNPVITYSYHQFREMNQLYALDSATKLPCPHSTSISGSGYSGIFYKYSKWVLNSFYIQHP